MKNQKKTTAERVNNAITAINEIRSSMEAIAANMDDKIDREAYQRIVAVYDENRTRFTALINALKADGHKVRFDYRAGEYYADKAGHGRTRFHVRVSKTVGCVIEIDAATPDAALNHAKMLERRGLLDFEEEPDSTRIEDCSQAV